MTLLIIFNGPHYFPEVFSLILGGLPIILFKTDDFSILIMRIDNLWAESNRFYTCKSNAQAKF